MDVTYVVIFVMLVAYTIFYFIANRWIERKRFKQWKEQMTVGSIRIDRSDPDGPYLFLELDKPVYTLNGKQEVIVKLIDEDYISQE